MKKLIFIALFFLSIKSFGQCQPKCCDTLPAIFLIADTSHWYNYYEKSGFLVYKQVKYSQQLATLYISKRQDFINKQVTIVEGFEIYQTDENCRMILVKKLLYNLQPLQSPYAYLSFGVPQNGF